MCEKITRNAMIYQTTKCSSSCLWGAREGLKSYFVGVEGGTGSPGNSLLVLCSMLLKFSHPSLHLSCFVFLSMFNCTTWNFCIQNAFLLEFCFSYLSLCMSLMLLICLRNYSLHLSHGLLAF